MPETRKGVLLRQGQQAAAAALGLRAIAGVPLDDLYAYAVDVVKDATGADFVYVVQLREGNELVVRAHVGRTDMNPVGRVLAAEGSIADFVMKNGEPVITPDFEQEGRYTPPPRSRLCSVTRSVRSIVASRPSEKEIHNRRLRSTYMASMRMRSRG